MEAAATVVDPKAGFKPSDVILTAPPLVGTMDRSEVEFAAACVVRGLQEGGDTWRPIAWPEIARVLRADQDAKREPFASLARNPFLRPDAYDLVARGFARWIDKPGDALEMTDHGIEKLRRWVRPRGDEQAANGGQ